MDKEDKCFIGVIAGAVLIAYLTTPNYIGATICRLGSFFFAFVSCYNMRKFLMFCKALARGNKPFKEWYEFLEPLLASIAFGGVVIMCEVILRVYVANQS